MTTSTPVGLPPAGGGPTVPIDREEFLADFGDRIRAERQSRGWTQSDLGTRAGISQKVIAYIEAGKSTIPLLHLVAICHGLGMTVGDLLSDHWQMPDRPERKASLTPRQIHILREAASGDPLPLVAARVGTTRQVVASRLSEAYRLLGVADLPREERRVAAFRAAEARGLLGTVHGGDTL
ncbi:helix-turn-helix domain-containing protein [Streptomyces scopuliridis]|uniref:helix-turn-helix domain-containing protein n=1 Tax=Streptomyces scopuliridis TaxID=452529 RepID=UPI00342FE7A2